MQAISVVYLEDAELGKRPLDFFSLRMLPGGHASAQFSVVADKDTSVARLQEQMEQAEFRIVSLEGALLFSGILQDVDLREENGFARLRGSLVSGTVLLDTVLKSRSFQDVSLTYRQVIEMVLQDTADAGVIFAAGTFDRPIGLPILQYRETDWQFINRMASRCDSFILPDIGQPKPWFYFGMKQRGEAVSFEEIEYRQTAGDKLYARAARTDWAAGDHCYVEVKSTQDFAIGDKTVFQDKSFVVCEKAAAYLQSEVIFTYKLAKESYNLSKRRDNEQIAGMTLLGTVLETAEERLKIHLDIDKEQDVKTAYPYKWVPPSGDLMYLMPEVGTRVSLYFPDNDEQHARAINCVRTNGGAEGACAAMGNFEERCLTTKHGKQMYFHPGTMGLVGKSGSIRQVDGEGLFLHSDLALTIVAQDEIKLIAPEVELDAKLELTMVQEED